MSNKIELNQGYREAATFRDYPEIKKIYDEYVSWCLEETSWGKYGRAYDCAVSLFQVDFTDKVVCELGARDSIFSSYLTKYVKQVHASDIFLGWGDLGDLDFWNNKWKEYAFNPDRLISEKQDMSQLTYPDNFFDVVVSFSAIEHVPGNGDIMSAREMARVCKPGGTIIIGTEISDEFEWFSGSYFYTEEELYKRIINPTGANLIGPADFDYETSDKVSFSGKNFTSSIFCLQKPEG